MIISVFLNALYLLFPFFCYFFYIIYSRITFEKEKNLFFDLMLFSSYYICSRFGEFNLSMILIINIPFVLALYKKRTMVSFLLAFLTAIFLSGKYIEVSYFIYLQYAVILILALLSSYKTINVFIVTKAIFGLIVFIYLPLSFNEFIFMILFFSLMYAFLYLVLILYNKTEGIIKMVHSLNEITKEKTLYESLFKITHEIKNPLAVCKGYLEMFDIKNEKKANKYINIINQEIDRTLLLLKDFSDVSKIKVEKNLMDISMLIEDVCDEVELAFNKDVKFKCNFFDEEVIINGDYNRIKQVLINMIKNAKESIIDEGLVILEGKVIKGEYIIYIKDNGIGMDKDTKLNIGKAFYTTKKNGTGLGVCLSKEIIERHGGLIEYFSKENKGTTVKVTLPINKTSF